MFQAYFIAPNFTSPMQPAIYYNTCYIPIIYENQIVSSPQVSSSQQIVVNSKKRTKFRKTKKSTKKTIKKSHNIKQRIIDTQFKLKAQNAKRNVISNIVHHLVSFIQRRKFSFPIISKIIELHKLEISPSDFYTYIQSINLKNYVRLETLKAIWKGSNLIGNITQTDFAKLFRIITYYFLNEQCYRSIQLSKKIRTNLKDDHLKKRREMIEMVCEE